MSGRASILIVDGDADERRNLAGQFERDGYRVGLADDCLAAMKSLSEHPWDIVLLDNRVRSSGGLDLLQHARRLDPAVPSILLTDEPPASAAEASATGSFAWVMRSTGTDSVKRAVLLALEQRQLQRRNLALCLELQSLSPADEVVGESAEAEALRARVHDAAGTDANVLIVGETGTEKEQVARMIHALSARSTFPFARVNCGQQPADCVEGELFGDDGGSTVDARPRHPGKLELASGGTLFLDEVTALDTRAQESLADALTYNRFQPVGARQPIPLDLRLVSATTVRLDRLVDEHRFRRDLAGRLGAVEIVVPALRERRDDILFCARRFMARYSAELHKPVTGISREAEELLLDHPWPGNLRELENAMERAVLVAREPVLSAEDLPLSPAAEYGEDEGSLAAVQRAHIVRMLKRQGWNITRTARILGIDRVTLYNKIRKYNLRKP